jgi:orotidine-5'-phosphate decarboxylase
MNNQSISLNPGLMLALDVEDFETADRILSQNRAFIDTVKLGSMILTSPKAGFKVISHIKNNYSIPVVIDSKLKDVPHVLLATSKSYAKHGASAITCWADIGEKALKLLINNLNGIVDIIILTALTSLPYKLQKKTAEENILMAVNCGCEFIQVPGNFPELIIWARKNIPDNINILSCGVGPQGGMIGNAISCGANHEIIGRKLLDYESDKKITACFKKTYKTIHKAFNPITQFRIRNS